MILKGLALIWLYLISSLSRPEDIGLDMGRVGLLLDSLLHLSLGIANLDPALIGRHRRGCVSVDFGVDLFFGLDVNRHSCFPFKNYFFSTTKNGQGTVYFLT